MYAADGIAGAQGGGGDGTAHADAPGRIERLLFRPVPLWSVALALLLMLAAAIGFGAIVDGWEKSGVLGRAAIAVARVPDTIKKLFRNDDAPYYRGKEFEKLPAGFSRAPGFTDTGYALLSPWDEKRGRSVVRLLRLRDGAVLREIVPDVDAANAASRFHFASTDLRRDKKASRNRLTHPLLLPDGSLIVHDNSPLARYDACGKLLWSIDGFFHHSTELGPDGTLWAPYRPPVPQQPGVTAMFADDALAQASLDGKLLKVERIADIFARNHLSGLWRGRPYSDDPFHLNDIQPVFESGRWWQRGDLFLSFRNLSMVALYRPSTGRILWWQSGPWHFQHDVNILDDHRISLFDNNSLIGYPDDRVEGTNRLLVYDFAAGRTSSPWAAGFARNHIATRIQGRGTPLPNGDAMIEETELGRLLRMAPDGTIRWRFISADSARRRFALAWARYLPSTDGPAIQAAVNQKCT